MFMSVQNHPCSSQSEQIQAFITVLERTIPMKYERGVRSEKSHCLSLISQILPITICSKAAIYYFCIIIIVLLHI